MKVIRAVAGTPPEVYSPSDDTFLMLDVLAKIPVEGKDILDMGTGSGILALYCAMRGSHVTATDINQKSLDHVKKAAQELQVSLRVTQSDLFSNVTGRFDLVIFNPPYLPSKRQEDQAVDGGKLGEEVALRFLSRLGNYLRKDGTGLLLLSSASDVSTLAADHTEFEFAQVANRSLFFEGLLVLQLRFRGKTMCQ